MLANIRRIIGSATTTTCRKIHSSAALKATSDPPADHLPPIQSGVPDKAEIVIAGAGLAGVSTAFHLMRSGARNIVVVDPNPALTGTSAYSTECYRDFWPIPAMTQLMGHSIDLMEQLAIETDNSFDMTRRGYVYLSADRANAGKMLSRAEENLRYTNDEARGHRTDSPAGLSGYTPAVVGSLTMDELSGEHKLPRGIDVVEGNVKELLPYVADDVCGMLHARRCGWVSAQQFGATMIEACKGHVKFVRVRTVSA